MQFLFLTFPLFCIIYYLKGGDDVKILVRKRRITSGQIEGLWDALVIIFFLVPGAVSYTISETERTGTKTKVREWILLSAFLIIGWLFALCIDIIIFMLALLAAIPVFCLTWKEKNRRTIFISTTYHY